MTKDLDIFTTIGHGSECFLGGRCEAAVNRGRLVIPAPEPTSLRSVVFPAAGSGVSDPGTGSTPTTGRPAPG